MVPAQNTSSTADVTVVLPFYNAEKTLLRALESVYAQTVPPKEIICINDGSTDHSVEIARKFGHDTHINCQVLDLPRNGGVAFARNQGMCRATGKYLAFLDADDAWSPHKIERQWQAMEQQNLDLLGGHSAVLRIEQAIPHETTSKILRITPVRLLPAMLSNPFHTSSVMMRRDTSMHFPQTGQLSEDYALWLARIAADWRCAHHPEALSFMFKQAYGDTGLSASLWRMQRGELIALLSLGWMTHPLLLALAIPFSCLKFGQRVLRTCSRSLVTRMGSPSG